MIRRILLKSVTMRIIKIELQSDDSKDEFHSEKEDNNEVDIS